MEENVLFDGAARMDEIRLFARMGRQVSYRSSTDGGMDYFKRSNATIQAVSRRQACVANPVVHAWGSCKQRG